MEKEKANTAPKTIDEKIKNTRGYVLYIGIVAALQAGMACYYLLASMTNSTTSNVVGAALYVVLFGLSLALQTYYILEYLRLLFEKLGNK